MINLELINNDFEYELKMLIRLFYPGKEIQRDCNGDLTIRASILDGSYECQVFYREKIVGNHSFTPEIIGDRKVAKRYMKVAVYHALSSYENKKIPWGILTGIRPTKIVLDLLHKGMNEKEIISTLKEDYCVSTDKIQLMLGICKTEEKVLSLNAEKEYSLYIGIPFCPTRCSYCSFTSYSLEKYCDQVEDYLEALIIELRGVKELVADRPLRSVYIGGGTPTSLNARQLDRLIGELKNHYPITDDMEFTVEAGRPDTITRDKLEVLRHHNINRISINPQTMNQATLEKIGRKHTTEEIETCFSLARELGFSNINMDVIVGLPEEGVEEISNTMDALIKLNPDSLTVHTMAIKRGSNLNQLPMEELLVQQNEIESMLNITAYGAAVMGMEPYYMYRQKNMVGQYENIGYAKPGNESIYNIEIMEEQESIIALGAGSVTKIVNCNGIQRVENVKNFRQYIDRIDEMIDRKKKQL